MAPMLCFCPPLLRGLPAPLPEAAPPAFPTAFQHPLPCFPTSPSSTPSAAAPTLTLSIPRTNGPPPPRNNRPSPTPPSQPRYRPPATPGPSDYSSWSSDFLNLCNEQLSLLMSTIPNLELAALFFRRENQLSGHLEFVPLIVHSAHDAKDKPPRVWVSAGAAGTIELEHSVSSRVLPGGIPASWILPDYPFASVSSDGGIPLPDAGLCIPVAYNNVIAGSIVLRPSVIAASPDAQWHPIHVQRADSVARSIALAAALEGKWRAYQGEAGSSRALVESIQSLLQTTLHQIRSPIQALVTFGHLLMKRLPAKNESRDLAKHVIVEALRIDELLEPLDTANEHLVLPEAHEFLSTADDSLHTLKAEALSPAAMGGSFPQPPFLPSRNDESTPNAQGDSASGVDSEGGDAEDDESDAPPLWLADVISELSSSTAILAEERGLSFSTDLDSDSPPVLGDAKLLREAVAALLDNALYYSPRGASVGLTDRVPEAFPDAFGGAGDDNDEDSRGVLLAVWDTGLGVADAEKEDVWQFGVRGLAAERVENEGSGLGLAIARQLLNAMEADITLCSPLPAMLDPRAESERTEGSPGTAFVIRMRRFSS